MLSIEPFEFTTEKSFCFCLEFFSFLLIRSCFQHLNSISLHSQTKCHLVGGVTKYWSFILIFFIKERLNKKWLFGYIFFQSLYLAILFYTYAGIPSILVVATVSVTLFCIWWLPPQQMRVVGGLNCFTYLAYQISIKNWAGLLEILVILSNFFSFLKYRKSNN